MYNQEYFLDKNHYNHIVDQIKFIETHISVVVLTGPYVYKLKKTVKFGNVLDFTTLNKRQFYTKEELRLNRRFSPNIYENIVCIKPTKIDSNLDKNYEYAVING